jgi:hypothetical protein
MKNKNPITKLLIYITIPETKWRLLSWFSGVDGVKEKKKGSEGSVIGKIKMKGQRSKAMHQRWGF